MAILECLEHSRIPRDERADLNVLRRECGGECADNISEAASLDEGINLGGD
jgi:hypothetical protein